MKAYLSRWVCTDVESNVKRIREEVCRAAMEGASLAVFPELFLTGYSRAVDPADAREAFGNASRAFPEVLCVFGSLDEDGANRLTAWLHGEEVCRYDKVHLFTPNGERDRWRPGDRYSALAWNGLRIGFATCNDIRFPEQARALALQGGTDLLVVPAWWPWRRDHIWAALLRARAVENSQWVLGCCIEASWYPGEELSGAGNHVFDPAGEPVRTPDDHTYVIDLERRPEPVVDTRAEHVEIGRVEIGQAP